MKKKKKYALGTGKNGVVTNYIETPNETLLNNELALAKAKSEVMSNPWIQGLDMFGNMAVQYGTSMMTSGNSGIPAGGKADNGGVVYGGGNGGKFGKSFGDWMGNNSQALSTGLGLLPMFAELMGPNFAFGGSIPGVPVEVEGKEAAETPDGTLINFDGPSHENGGIDVNLPEGTEVFSKRIKVGGETMAQRKNKRERKLLTLEKLLDKNSGDIALQNTIKRTKQNNDAEEAYDQNLQDQVNQMKKMLTANPAEQKFDGGGTVLGNFLRSIFGGQQPNEFVDFNSIDSYSDNASASTGLPAFNTTPGFSDFSYADNGELIPNDPQVETPGTMPNLPKFTPGDLTSLYGTLYSTFKPMQNTQEQRAGDTPNINAFENFGVDALSALDNAGTYAAGIRDKALSDIETGRTRVTVNNRNSARSVNTQRALDLASEVNANKAEGDVYDNFAQQMMSLAVQRAGLENQQDQAVMAGEQARDLADRQDRDNYYSQLAEDIATKGEGIQTIGKMLNQNRKNTMTEQAINDSSLNFKYENGVLTDKNGNPVLSDAQIASGAKALGISKEKYIELITKANG